MGVGAGLYMCDAVKKVHVRYLISWWVLVQICERTNWQTDRHTHRDIFAPCRQRSNNRLFAKYYEWGSFHWLLIGCEIRRTHYSVYVARDAEAAYLHVEGPLRQRLSRSIYLRQGGYVIVAVCLSVCLSVSNFAQKLPNGFAWNFQGRLAMGQWTNG